MKTMDRRDWPQRGHDQSGAILVLLRDTTGIHFSLYRQSTLQRRIMRRLALRNIGSLEEYRAQIESAPDELRALHRDVLITVIRFPRCGIM